MDKYREKVITSYLYLRSMQEGLLDSIIDVAMSGEYKEINDSFSPGDSYEFDLLQFRDTDDENLNKLLKVHDEMVSAMESLLNLNVITEEEIEEVEKGWMDLFNLDFLDFDDDDEDYEEYWDEFEDDDFDEDEFDVNDFNEKNLNGEDSDFDDDIDELPF